MFDVASLMRSVFDGTNAYELLDIEDTETPGAFTLTMRLRPETIDITRVPGSEQARVRELIAQEFQVNIEWHEGASVLMFGLPYPIFAGPQDMTRLHAEANARNQKVPSLTKLSFYPAEKLIYGITLANIVIPPGITDTEPSRVVVVKMVGGMFEMFLAEAMIHAHLGVNGFRKDLQPANA